MRFVEYLPIISEQLPVCLDGTDVSVSYYLFNKGASAENPNGDNFPILHYAHEVAYAYRQLINCTNILDCGRVRFFMAEQAQEQMMPYFKEIGLSSLVVPIEVPVGVQLSGYIPHLSSEHLDPCKYRFHNDTDLWWLLPEGAEKFDWRNFCNLLDTANDDAFFGQPIEKPEWVYQVNFSQHALPHNAREKAAETLRKIFGPRIPLEFIAMATADAEALREQKRPSSLRCFGGWFVGIKSQSNAEWYLQDFYEKHKEVLSDDEGLYALLFHLFPFLEQFQVLQGSHPPIENQVEQTSLLNFTSLENAGVINVGVQEFYTDQYRNERIGLSEFILGEPHAFENVVAESEQITTEGADLTIPAHHLRMFGKHIIGTYALDANGCVFPLITHSENNHSVLFGFPSAFMPIKYPIPYSLTDTPEVVVFFCIFSHPMNATHEVHAYAKSMTYAAKMLAKNTNIFDVGRVLIFVDERVMNTVYPYCREANLQKLVVPFKSNKQVQYAAYIPHFYHEAMGDIPIRMYMDVDMWWINLANDEKFDYRHLAKAFRECEADVFGNSVPKRPDWTYQDLYSRSIYEGDTHVERAKRWMVENFGAEVPDTTRSITGCHNGIRLGLSLEKLERFYEEVGEFIRDDEAFWTVFFARHPEIQIKQITDLIRGVSFRNQEVKLHDKAELSHVGTYMFEHFFGKPNAKKFYEHCSE